jgi:hypothetical protein
MAAKTAARRRADGKNANLRLLCSTLLAEREQMQEQLKKLREENGQLKRSLGALLCDDIPINKRAMLAQTGKGPSLAELIAELEKAEA